MSSQPQKLNEIEEIPPAMTWQSALLLMLASAMGAMLAALLLPAWLPGISASVLGSAPKLYWFLSRASAFVSFILLWLSMALGLMISNKLARLWPCGPLAFDVHQYTSLLGLAFSLFHALILLGDQFIGYGLAQILIPFGSVGYQPLWVGLGQIGIYLWLFVVLSFYIRKQIGHRSWRAIHYLSFMSFALALVHGVVSGSDNSSIWALRIYWLAGGSLLFLTVYRVIVSPRLNPKRSSRAVASR